MKEKKPEIIIPDIRRTFMLAKLAITILVLSMFIIWNDFIIAWSENNIYRMIFYSVIFAIQLAVWIWNVFL